jgi:hypothetical protein
MFRRYFIEDMAFFRLLAVDLIGRAVGGRARRIGES